jgi:hypothetical protein
MGRVGKRQRQLYNDVQQCTSGRKWHTLIYSMEVTDVGQLGMLPGVCGVLGQSVQVSNVILTSGTALNTFSQDVANCQVVSE